MYTPCSRRGRKKISDTPFALSVQQGTHCKQMSIQTCMRSQTEHRADGCVVYVCLQRQAPWMSLAVLACRWWTTARIEGACGWAGYAGMHVHFPAACTSACVLLNFWFLCVSQLLHDVGMRCASR